MNARTCVLFKSLDEYQGFLISIYY